MSTVCSRRLSPRRQEVIAPLHDAAQSEAAPPQAHPLGPQDRDEDEGEEAGAGGEEGDGRGRRVAASEPAATVRGDRGRGGEPRDGVRGGDLEWGGAVVELVVQDLGIGAGDLEVAQGVWVQAVYAGGAGCYLAFGSEAGLVSSAAFGGRRWEDKEMEETHSRRPC